MGLDQTLNWYGRPSKDQIKRLFHRNISKLGSYGLISVDEEGFNERHFENIKKYAIPQEVYVEHTNWDYIEEEFDVPDNYILTGLSRYNIRYADPDDRSKEVICRLDPMSKKYQFDALETRYFYLEDEVYRWRNNYDIQDLFNKTFPDVYDEHESKYEMVYGGNYKLTKKLLSKMKKIDSVFAERYGNEIDNIYYSANW